MLGTSASRRLQQHKLQLKSPTATVRNFRKQYLNFHNDGFCFQNPLWKSSKNSAEDSGKSHIFGIQNLRRGPQSRGDRIQTGGCKVAKGLAEVTKRRDYILPSIRSPNTGRSSLEQCSIVVPDVSSMLPALGCPCQPRPSIQRPRHAKDAAAARCKLR